MRFTENTKVRIKVPKHLYEAIQAEFDKKGEMEEGEDSIKEYVGMSPDQMQLVDTIGTLIASGALGGLVLASAKTLYKYLKNKMSTKGSTENPVAEETDMEEAYHKDNMEEGEDSIKEYVGMSPDQAQLMDILGTLIASGALGGLVLASAKTVYKYLKNKMSTKGSTKTPVTEETDMEEALDLESLMEAVDAVKKKAKDKKEVEAKKKKVEDEKKKKEAEAKKKAAAAKKK